MPSTFHPLLSVAGEKDGPQCHKARELTLPHTSSTHRRVGPTPCLESTLELTPLCGGAQASQPKVMRAELSCLPHMPPITIGREGPKHCLCKTGPGNVSEGDLDLRAQEQDNWPYFFLKATPCELA